MRRLSISVIALLIAALALPTAASAGSPRDRTTGGGQILDAEQLTGAGDTIAWTAQGDPAVAGDGRGQIQYVDRTGGTGQGQSQYHYEVTCVEVDGNMAYVSGTLKQDRKATGSDTDTITLYIVDNGEGSADGNDIVVVNPTTEDDSDEDDPCGVDSPGAETALARGNAQVHDAADES